MRHAQHICRTVGSFSLQMISYSEIFFRMHQACSSTKPSPALILCTMAMTLLLRGKLSGVKLSSSRPSTWHTPLKKTIYSAEEKLMITTLKDFNTVDEKFKGRFAADGSRTERSRRFGPPIDLCTKRLLDFFVHQRSHKERYRYS